MSELDITPSRPLVARPVGAGLDDDTRDLIAEAPSPNTLRAYDRWWKRYIEWAEHRGLEPIPATGDNFANFVKDLIQDKAGVPTIRTAMAAVRWGHALAGHQGKPESEFARLALRAYRKRVATAGKSRVKKATPISLDDLQKMIDACHPATYRGVRDRLILVLGWAGMFRRSELAALMFGDVHEVPDGLIVFVARSKTDKDALGAEVPIPPGTHPESDPVRLLRTYLEVAAAQGITSGRLFRGVTRGGRVTGDITDYAINELIKAAAVRAKLPNPSGYTAHSLRAGGATAAYRKGAAVSTIANHGRWAPNSPVVLGYIRSVDRWKDNPMRGIGL